MSYRAGGESRVIVVSARRMARRCVAVRPEPKEAVQPELYSQASQDTVARSPACAKPFTDRARPRAQLSVDQTVPFVWFSGISRCAVRQSRSSDRQGYFIFTCGTATRSSHGKSRYCSLYLLAVSTPRVPASSLGSRDPAGGPGAAGRIRLGKGRIGVPIANWARVESESQLRIGQGSNRSPNCESAG